MTTLLSPTMTFLRTAIEQSPKTQREIARDAGFPAPNVLSMMKSGECKVPISRIPALAKTLDVDCEQFVKIAMREYHPEIWIVIEEVMDNRFTEFERELLGSLEFICGRAELPWDEATQSLMNGVFRILRDRHLRTIGKAARFELDPEVYLDEISEAARERAEADASDEMEGGEEGDGGFIDPKGLED